MRARLLTACFALPLLLAACGSERTVPSREVPALAVVHIRAAGMVQSLGIT
jgi:hypothetical protein